MNERDALGLAVCKGANRGKPQHSWKALCSRSSMCPGCERVKAGRRAWKINERLKDFDEETNGDFAAGVLTLTGPGRDSEFRRADLRTQYEYMTARVTLPGFVGHHSMRGVNKLLTDHGASGGTHFIEFTFNQVKDWWNVHTHTLFWGDERLSILKDCSEWSFPEDGPLLGERSVRGRQSVGLQRLGFGKRYSLDYAEDHELESMIRYSSKVAYATKPFKAPIWKRGEIQDFLIGLDGKEPRLARPFGDAIKSRGLQDFLSWDRCQQRKDTLLREKEARKLEKNPVHVENRQD